MIARGLVILAVIAALWSAPLAADEAAEIAFWQTISNSSDPAEFEAYLRAFPEGNFVALARLRIKALQGSGKTEPRASDQEESAAAVEISIVPAQSEYRAVDRIVVDVDARQLQRGSNWRIAVVPAGTPAITDANALALISEDLKPARQRLSLDPGPPGEDEIRVYFIPQFSRSFELAGTASISVGPAYPGATIVQDLAQEAAALGPLRFEAEYRDRTILVQGQFLRLDTRTQTPGFLDLLRGEAREDIDYVALYLGHLGTPDRDGSPTEVLCLMPAEDRAVLQALSELNPGDDVVLTGTASTWGSGFASQAIIFNPCGFAG